MNNPSLYLYEKSKEQFEGTTLWSNNEAEISIFCSDYRPSLDNEGKIKRLKEFKEMLTTKGANPDDLMYIDEEIESIKGTRQVSLYNENDLFVDEETLERFISNVALKQGMIATEKDLNWDQLSDLTNKIYHKTQQVKFFISPNTTLKGQVVAHVFETPIEIPIATVYKRKKKNDDVSDPTDYFICLFGQAVDKKKFDKVKELTEDFYLIQFLAEDNKEYNLLSDEKIDIGDYTIKGVMTKLQDNKKVSETARLTTKIPYIFVFSHQNRITKFKSHQELSQRLEQLMVKKETLFNVPFTNEKNGKLFLLHHPEWFKWMMWSWLVHAKHGGAGFNEYPLHILMMAKQGTGKTSLMNALLRRSKEKEIFSGSASTLKGLIPSFKHTPVKIGHMAMSNRFALIDEFLRCIFTSNTANDTSKEEVVGLMNDLLEHQKRVAGSGVSSVSINMTARAFATSNPAREIRDMPSLLENLDNSFLSRWLIYWQDESHIELVKNNEGMLESYHYDITLNDWLSLIDYLHSFEVEYDVKRVRVIYRSLEGVLSRQLLNHYKSRHIHHICCLMDGIVKTRCVMERDMSFKATDDDYEKLEEIWAKIVRSWLNLEDLRHKDPKDKLYFMPEDAQWLFGKVQDKKRPLSNFDMKELVAGEIANGEMTLPRFREMVGVLIDQNILKQTDDGTYVPYWWGEKDE